MATSWRLFAARQGPARPYFPPHLTIATYRTALEVWPGHIQTMQAVARLEVLSGRSSSDLDGWLAEIALRGETEPWREWARRSLH